MKRPNARTLLLNADSSVIKLVPWQKAMSLIVRGKAIQVDFYEGDCIRDGKGRFYAVPAVIILKKYIRKKYKKASFSKYKVFARDNYTCQYCLRELKPNQLNLDHVIPTCKWKGKDKGKSTCWTNIVTSCFPCNKKKGDYSCDEVGMFPHKSPVQPTEEEVFFSLHFHNKVEPEWEKWLSSYKSFQQFEKFERRGDLAGKDIMVNS